MIAPALRALAVRATFDQLFCQEESPPSQKGQLVAKASARQVEEAKVDAIQKKVGKMQALLLQGTGKN